VGRKNRRGPPDEIYTKLDNLRRSNSNIFIDSEARWQPFIELGSVIVHPVRDNFGFLITYCEAAWLKLIAPQINATFSTCPKWALCILEMEPTWIDAQDLHTSVLDRERQSLSRIQRHFQILDLQSVRLFQLQNLNWVPRDANELDYMPRIVEL
jgi:hypothetical protein